MKKTKRTLLLSFIFFLLWFIGHIIYITIDGLTDDGKKADVAVILGSKVNKDGTLSERLDNAWNVG